jgi:very-short-patch-repair endonuclease
MARRVWTIDTVKDYLSSFGYTCLEDTYINTRTKMNVMCDKDHLCFTKLNSYTNGYRCLKCSGKQKYTISDVRDYLKTFNYRCLTNTYKNALSRLEIVCDKDHISFMTFANFKNSGSRCLECSGKKKYTIKDVKDYLAEFNYTCLEDVYVGANEKMRFVCDKNHHYITTFSSIKSGGKRCLQCCINLKHTISSVKDYVTEFNYICLEDNYINNKTKMKFKCDKGHLFKMRVSCLKNNVRCPKCLYKTEGIVDKFLQENYSNIVCQPKFEWCKSKRCLPFDFLIEHLKILIEVDGAQHFLQVMNWDSPEKTLERDVFKAKAAIQNGYSVIRISQEDIFNNTIDWQEMINDNVKEYSQPTCVYISKDPNLYDKHKTL